MMMLPACCVHIAQHLMVKAGSHTHDTFAFVYFEKKRNHFLKF
jgi:hypothetical protein